MRLIVLEIFAAIALTLAAIIASATGASASDVVVIRAFARASATPVAKSGVAYITIRNDGAKSDRLMAIDTPSANTTMAHRTIMDGDIMKMDAAGIIEVPAHGILEMAPGGLHLMLMGLKKPLVEGEAIQLKLTFENAGDLSITVPVASVAANGQN
jgi:copper(I)-binding protein